MSDDVITRDEVIDIFGALADIEAAAFRILSLLEDGEDEEDDIPES